MFCNNGGYLGSSFELSFCSSILSNTVKKVFEGCDYFKVMLCVGILFLKKHSQGREIQWQHLTHIRVENRTRGADMSRKYTCPKDLSTSGIMSC